MDKDLRTARRTETREVTAKLNILQPDMLTTTMKCRL